LKWLALVLISYIISTLLIKGLNWGEIGLHAITPNIDFSKEQMILICGILGTTISPYLFFWQTSQEVEEQILDGKTTIEMRQIGTSDKDIKDMRIDIWSGMFLSNLAMFFIIAACAATLNLAGITNIETAAQAAEALRPLAGDWSYALFAIGIIGVGLLGIPVLAGSASYAISESFGWKQGLHYKLKQAYSFYGIIIFSTLIGLGLNFIGLDPIKALIYSAVANGLVAPVVLVLIVLLGSNKKIMGNRVNGPWAKTIGWIATGLMVVAGLATIYSLVTG
jgi:Mn2+/Fe2+ NRAMP family transporter